jgi:hypothetical protein
VLGALLREGELDSVDLRVEPDRRDRENEVWLRLTVRGGETLQYVLCKAAQVSAEVTAERFYEVLQDEIPESRFAWGEPLRSGDDVVPLPA